MTARPDYHTVRDMPSCRWSGGHVYDLLKYENGMRVEICRHCRARVRAYPIVGHSGMAKVIDFPISDADLEAAGSGGMK